MNSLQAYLEEIFGILEKPIAEKEIARHLPLYLRGSYDLYSSKLAGQKVIWAIIRNLEGATPDRLKKQNQSLQEILGQVPIVYVFEFLESWKRKRLIEKKVAFAEPFRQLYIPQLFTQIMEGQGKESLPIVTGSLLKPPAQILLLYHLQIQNLEKRLLQEIAELLNYSPMTITRSIKELSLLGLVRVEGTKEKSIFFAKKGKELWVKALPHLRSPIRDTVYFDRNVHKDYVRLGGETALAHYGMLSEPNQDTIVIGKDRYRNSKSQFELLDKKQGTYKLEIWHYDPGVLSKGEAVDKLSLYLTLKDHTDERVIGALRHMINELIW